MRFLTLKNYIGLLGYIITYMGVEVTNIQAFINSILRITIEITGQT